MNTEVHSHPKPNYGAVFMALFVFTLIEIFVANLHLYKVLIILALIFLALVKALLVAMFYMHLKYEKVLLALMALSPLLFSILLTLMVGLDIGHPRI